MQDKSSIFLLTIKKTLWDAYDHLGILIVINLIATFLSVFVITAPAAMAGVWFAVRRLTQDGAGGLTEFYSGFKNYFKVSFLFVFSYWLCVFGVIFGFVFFWNQEGWIHWIGLFLETVALWIIGIFAMAGCYGFSLMVLDVKLKSVTQIWVESFVLFLAQPLNTLKFVTCLGFWIFLCAWTRLLTPILGMSFAAVFLVNGVHISKTILAGQSYIMPKRNISNFWRPWEGK